MFLTLTAATYKTWNVFLMQKSTAESSDSFSTIFPTYLNIFCSSNSSAVGTTCILYTYMDKIFHLPELKKHLDWIHQFIRLSWSLYLNALFHHFFTIPLLFVPITHCLDIFTTKSRTKILSSTRYIFHGDFSH